MATMTRDERKAIRDRHFAWVKHMKSAPIKQWLAERGAVVNYDDETITRANGTQWYDFETTNWYRYQTIEKGYASRADLAADGPEMMRQGYKRAGTFAGNTYRVGQSSSVYFAHMRFGGSSGRSITPVTVLWERKASTPGRVEN